MSLEYVVHKNMVTIPENYSIFEACMVMAEKNIGAILIQKDNQVIGIFTERDLLKRVIPSKVNVMTKIIGEVMTTNLKRGISYRYLLLTGIDQDLESKLTTDAEAERAFIKAEEKSEVPVG